MVKRGRGSLQEEEVAKLSDPSELNLDSIQLSSDEEEGESVLGSSDAESNPDISSATGSQTSDVEHGNADGDESDEEEETDDEEGIDGLEAHKSLSGMMSKNLPDENRGAESNR